MATPHSRFQRRYPAEMRERAIRMVRESIAERGERQGAVSRVARQLGIGTESLRNRVKRADIDTGKRPRMTTTEQRRTAELERENRELRRANEMADSTGGRRVHSHCQNQAWRSPKDRHAQARGSAYGCTSIEKVAPP